MASRFWVGGTGTWDAATTTHWAASSGGAGGQSVPTSADTVTFDASSGGGTVTLNFGGPITVQSITMGAFTGTWDNSVNNDNITVTAAAGFSITGTGTRTVKLGTATYTLSANNASWSSQNVTNLTYTGNTSANIVFTGASSLRSFLGGGLSNGNVTFGASSGAGYYLFSGANTLASLIITAPNCVQLPNAVTNTISGAFTWSGSSVSQILIESSLIGNTATIAAAGGSTASWASFRDVTFTGSPTATDSFDLGNNSGITITPPGGAGSSISGGAGVIGS
jgi:hypothetical protein